MFQPLPSPRRLFTAPLAVAFAVASAVGFAATAGGCAAMADGTKAGPADPMHARAAPPVPAAPPALTGTTWEWQRTIMSDDQRFEPKAPAHYTVNFGADGRMAMRADCNRGTGGYEVDESERRIRTSPLALTRAMCSAGSLDTAFAQQLARIQFWLFQGSDLVLTLNYSSGSMFFRAAAK